MNNFRIILVFVACILLFGCSSRSRVITESEIEFVTQLEVERSLLSKLMTRIEREIQDKDDASVPYRILVLESEASRFKERIRYIYQTDFKDKNKLKPLVNIIESCENRENLKISWDEYCFYEVPWFGVEPILNTWLNDITQAINNLE